MVAAIAILRKELERAAKDSAAVRAAAAEASTEAKTKAVRLNKECGTELLRCLGCLRAFEACLLGEAACFERSSWPWLEKWRDGMGSDMSNPC